MEAIFVDNYQFSCKITQHYERYFKKIVTFDYVLKSYEHLGWKTIRFAVQNSL